jgi:uncharacterized protein DUF4260
MSVATRGLPDRLPRVLLHAEGGAVALAAVALYFYGDYPWWLLVVLILAPDLSLAGYLAGQRVGTATYNAAHTYVPAVVLGAVGVIAGADVAVQLALIWITHIGVDRAVGYGLKYRTSFKETHLQRVGSAMGADSTAGDIAAAAPAQAAPLLTFHEFDATHGATERV